MKKWILIAGMLIAVVGTLAAYGAIFGGAAVDVARVESGTIREFVDERGQTRLPKVHRITMPYNGRIQSIDLAEGTAVSAGQVVAQVVPLDLEIELAASQAAIERLSASIEESSDTSVERTALEQAGSYVDSMDHTVDAASEQVRSGEAKLRYADSSLSRQRTLHERGTISIDELEQAEVDQVEGSVQYNENVLVLRAMQSMQAGTALLPTVIAQYIDRKALAVAVLERERTQAEANLREVQKDQLRGTMTSPIDGVILTRDVNNERALAAGTLLLEIGQLEQLQVETDVLSQDVVNIEIGDPVEIYGPAIGAQIAHGEVSKIYPAGFTKISSLGVEQQRVKVLIDFAAEEMQRLLSDRHLGVGYRVTVRIFTAEAAGTMLIPRSAIFRDMAGQWHVYVVDRGRAALRSLELGLMNDQVVEVSAGLAQDDMVILAPETSLHDGTRVQAQVR